MMQKQLDIAKNNKEIEISSENLFNVYYSLQRRIIKKIYKERKNYGTLFAMNKSDLHLTLSEKLKNSENYKKMRKK